MFIVRGHMSLNVLGLGLVGLGMVVWVLVLVFLGLVLLWISSFLVLSEVPVLNVRLLKAKLASETSLQLFGREPLNIRWLSLSRGALRVLAGKTWCSMLQARLALILKAGVYSPLWSILVLTVRTISLCVCATVIQSRWVCLLSESRRLLPCR